jgi:tripartite-type tricarboxylate transporter receptor subunit TctC
MPAIRAINETLPGYDATQWFGVLGPAALPRPIVDRLQQEIVKALRNPEMKTRLTNEGADVIASTPEEFSAYIKAETDKWGKVIRDAALKPQ